MIEFMLSLALLSSNNDHVATQLQDSGSGIRCEITLHDWCIAENGGIINMTDMIDRRVWQIVIPSQMKHGPLVIIETKQCSTITKPDVKFVASGVNTDIENKNVATATFEIGTDGCELIFRWPQSEAGMYPYKEFMLYRVLVGDSHKQLYHYYDKIRCNGRFVSKDSCDR